MDKLGRYYTKDNFSRLLVNQLSIQNPEKILELGVGGGSLLRAAINRWNSAAYFVADVDPKSITRIKTEWPFVNSFHVDTVKEAISAKLNITDGVMDIAVCNPPYLKIKTQKSYQDLFDSANIPQCKSLRLLTSDIVFLARNLELIKSKGELGIILPDSLITGQEFKVFRESILVNHNLKGIIELPERIFAKTEALTHILVIEKSKPVLENIKVFKADRLGKIVDQVEVGSDELIERMDFKYHAWKHKTATKKKFKVLGDYKVEIRRGTATHGELKELNDNYLHTTTIIDKHKSFSIKNSTTHTKNQLVTKKGDILIARVGRGCIGKSCMIGRGQALVSDCLYVIRVPEKIRLKFWHSLISPQGKNWMKANTHGVCAKVLSKASLLKFPIFNQC